jgi:hypothetical protein
MKTIITILLLASVVIGQSTSIDDVTISASFNDFAAVKAAIEVNIQWAMVKAYAEYGVDYWDGDSWELADFKKFWDPTPPVYDETFDDDVYLENIADEGDGSFRLGVYSYADYEGAIHEWSYFTVTDVVAPSAPSDFADDNATSGNPTFDWTANTETDLEATIFTERRWEREALPSKMPL